MIFRIRSVALGAWFAVFMTSVAANAQPLAEWVFAEANREGNRVSDVAGSFDATIEGEYALISDPWEALRFDGQTTSVDVPGVEPGRLPSRKLTLEAVVTIDAGMRWGGIIGYLQDNGDYEKGWLLGYNDSTFCFAVSANGRLTYLNATTRFEKGRWYHVAGVYDGAAMRIYVNGRLEASSSAQSGDIDYPSSAFLTLGAYRDDDEFYRSAGAIREVRLHAAALDDDDIRSRFSRIEGGLPQPVQFVVPPYARFISPEAAVVRWETAEARPTILEYGREGGWDERIESAEESTTHEATISGLRFKRKYAYRIVDFRDGRQVGVTEPFELDNSLNYARPLPSGRGVGPSRPPGLERARTVAQAVRAARNEVQGLCVVLGVENGELLEQLASGTRLQVVAVETDVARVQEARERLYPAGLYGTRATVHHVQSLARIPFPDGLANVVVVGGALDGGGDGVGRELLRLLRPYGGLAILSSGQADLLKLAEVVPAAISVSKAGRWRLVSRRPEAGLGSWTHQYGDGGNSANSHENLSGATGTDQLAAQWFGPPGADFGLDRNPRMPAPLASNGRLFHQGMNRMMAVDSFNGTVLWSLEIPDLRRVNMPRDASNWCADADRVYTAILDRCWVIDAATGEVERTLPLPASALRGRYEWGYVGQAGNRLIGSRGKMSSSFTDFWGGASWYDKTSGYGTEKVCSDELFALAKASGDRLWSYRKGAILNATVALSAGRVYFVESRHPEVLRQTTGRIGVNSLWEDQFLVALDASTGKAVWETPIDTVDGIVVFFLSCNEDAVVLASSAAGNYHLYGFGASDGKARWEASHKWPSDNHGGHMQHPVMFADKVYLEPCGYDLRTGERFTSKMGLHEGCTTYTGTLNALVYRGESRRISMWDMATGRVTSWYNLRPSCWLSTIAADGMVLAPEGGGGCSCGNWLETSLAFSPALGDWPQLTPGEKVIHTRVTSSGAVSRSEGSSPAVLATSADWPTYQYDNHRSGITPAEVDLPLAVAWAHDPVAPPQAAWTGPAKWDSYANIRDLKPMRNFDPVFHVTSVGDRLYYGSSVDNAVHCLDAGTGREIWVRFTDGPVRLPPSWQAGRLYFGSDDGFAYCVDAATGDVIWKYNPSGENRLVAHLGKMISFWPCRTAVLVQDRKAYFGASLFPWRESFLCALDAETGHDEGLGLYRETHRNMTMQGALLASPTRLYIPQGRQRPEMFDIARGESLGGIGNSGNGGVYSVLTKDDSTLVHGRGQNHGSRGELRGYSAQTKDYLVAFPTATCLVVTDEIAYLQSLDELAAFHRARYLQLSKHQIELTGQLNKRKDQLKKLRDKASGPEGETLRAELAELETALAPLPQEMEDCFLWKTESLLPHALVLAGETLFAGGTDRVAAFRVDDGKQLWEASVEGRAFGLAAARGKLFVSTDTGRIYCFTPLRDRVFSQYKPARGRP